MQNNKILAQTAMMMQQGKRIKKTKRQKVWQKNLTKQN